MAREAGYRYLVRFPPGFFKGRIRRYSSLDFIAQVTLHVPQGGSHAKRDGSSPRGEHLVRRYGLYSSRGRGTWHEQPALRARAPASWYGRTASAEPALPGTANDHVVDALTRRRAWNRLLAKVHTIDVLACPRCGSRIAVIAVITDPAQTRRAIGAAQESSTASCATAGDLLPLGGALRRPLDAQAVRPSSYLAKLDFHGSSMSTPARSSTC
jgi:hypothetical protein